MQACHPLLNLDFLHIFTFSHCSFKMDENTFEA